MTPGAQASEPSTTGLPVAVVAAVLFAVSGCAGLVCEVVWVRLLGLAFGHTVYAASAVLTAFMAGLALGSYAGARWQPRDARHALRLFAVVHLGLALYAALSPLLLANVQSILPLLDPASRTWYGLGTACQLVAALVVLLPGTGLMGAALPMIVRAVAADAGQCRRTVGLLYGLNTAGAALGCLGASFCLIPAWGTLGAIALAAGLYLLVACCCCALCLGRRALRVSAVRSQAASADGAQLRPDDAGSVAALPWLLAGSGFCGLALETCWTRYLMPVVGVDVQAFSLVLTAVLFGLAGGGLLASWRVLDSRPARALFAGCLLLASITTAASVPLLLGLAGLGSAAAASAAAGRFACAFGVVCLPTLCMGAALPIGAHLLCGGHDRAGRAAGLAVAWNTAGGVVGALFSGFVLIPALGVSRAVLVVACVYVLMAAVAAWPLRAQASVRGLGPRAIAGGLAFVLVSAMAWVTARTPPLAVKYASGANRVVFYQEGISCSIAVVEDARDRSIRTLDVNGEVMANTGYDSSVTHKLLGHLPCMLSPVAKDVLVIGFGSGMTAASALLHADRVDCAEIEPAQRGAAVWFDAENAGVLSDPRFAFHVADGRTFLSARRTQYDVIILDRMHPRICQDLFSAEFLSLCRSRLTPRGSICFCLPTGLCPDIEGIKQLVSTFHSQFAYSSLWYIDSQTSLLLGSPRPHEIDYRRLLAAFAEPRTHASLQSIHVTCPNDLLALFVANEDALLEWAGRGEVVRDSHPIGFRWPAHALEPHGVREWIEGVLRLRMSGLQGLRRRLVSVPQGYWAGPLRYAMRTANGLVLAHQAFLDRDFDTAAQMGDSLVEAAPGHAAARFLTARAYEAKARQAWRLGRRKQAARAADRAVALAPEFAWAHATRAAVHEDLGECQEAIAAYRRALVLNPLYDFAAQRLQALAAK